MWASFMVCAECLLLSIAASFLYKKSDFEFDDAVNGSAAK